MWEFFKINGFEINAKIYSEPSKNGLFGGRISKLDIKKDNKLIYAYDRGTIEINTTSNEYIDLIHTLLLCVDNKQYIKSRNTEG